MASSLKNQNVFIFFYNSNVYDPVKTKFFKLKAEAKEPITMLRFKDCNWSFSLPLLLTPTM